MLLKGIKCPLCKKPLELQYEDEHREVKNEDFTFENGEFDFDGDAFEEAPFIIQCSGECSAEFEINDDNHIVFYNSDGNGAGIFEDGIWAEIDAHDWIHNCEIRYL
ncbi:MAG TPA: hypothetical protein PLA54_04635 [Spirochaetota bacterium]|nr:hypothetical protein [Spirochaetota bacterium]HQE58466.1 hypothetical protein [Spirochaetota bacterium]